MDTITFAFRNLLRNTRRSIMTLIALTIGYAAISLFGGYISNVYDSLQIQAVSGERLGHLTIYKEGMLDEGRLRPIKYLFTEEEGNKLKEVVNEYGVKLVTPGLPISGLFNTDSGTSIFIGDGVVAEDIPELRGELDESFGGKLSVDNEIGIAMSSEMGRLLDIGEGGLPILVTTTFRGQANAMDAEIVDIYDTGNAGTNDKSILVPFKYAQNLMDTEGYQRFVVLLNDIEMTKEAQAELTKRLASVGLSVEIKTWRDLSSFYNQVRGLFDMIFIFIFSIVIVIIVMSIINTMSMTVVERTREIGTLRAVGLGKSGIVKLFTLEAVLLAFAGVLFGAILSILVKYGIDVAKISYTPPNSSGSVPLIVDFNFTQMGIIFLFIILLSAIAAAFPAFKAARKEIYLSLSHV